MFQIDGVFKKKRKGRALPTLMNESLSISLSIVKYKCTNTVFLIEREDYIDKKRVG